MPFLYIFKNNGFFGVSIMSRAIACQLFVPVQTSGLERKKIRKKKFWEKAARLAIYATAIAAFAVGHDSATQFAAAASGICLSFECFR